MVWFMRLAVLVAIGALSLWSVQLAVLVVIGVLLLVRYRDFRQDLYAAVIAYPGLFAVMVLLYLIVYGIVGASFGIQNLFWSEWLTVRLGSAAACTILLGLIGTIVYDLDPHPERTAHRVSAFRRRGPGAPAPGASARYEIHLGEFLHVARWPFLILLVLPALLPDLFPRVPRVVPFRIKAWRGAHDELERWFARQAGMESIPTVEGYLFSLAVWIIGIALGVLVYNALLWMSARLHNMFLLGVVPYLVQASEKIQKHWNRHAYLWRFLFVFVMAIVALATWRSGNPDWGLEWLMVVSLVVLIGARGIRRAGGEGRWSWVWWSVGSVVRLAAIFWPAIPVWAGRLTPAQGLAIVVPLFLLDFGVWFWIGLDWYIRKCLGVHLAWVQSAYQEIASAIVGLWTAVPRYVKLAVGGGGVVVGIAAFWWVGGIERRWAIGLVVLLLLTVLGRWMLQRLDELVLLVVPGKRWRSVISEFTKRPIDRCEELQRSKAAGQSAAAAGSPGCPQTGCPADVPALRGGAFPDCFLERDRKVTIRTLVLCFGLFYGLSAWVPFFYDRYYPSVAICLLLGLLAMVVAAVAYFRPRRTIVHLFVLAAYIGLVNNQTFKNRFEHMDEYYRRPVSLRDAVAYRYGSPDLPERQAKAQDPDVNRRGADVVLVNNEESLAAWKRNVKGTWDRVGARPMKPKLVVISVSGGAARSAYWSALVVRKLAEYIDRKRGFASFDPSVRIITGTSGGMVGMACYLEHRYRESKTPGLRGQEWIDQVPTDSLDKLAPYVMLRDFPRSLLPRPPAWQIGGEPPRDAPAIEEEDRDEFIEEVDRGTFLEKQWTYFDSRALSDYAGEEAGGRIPSLILSPMMIEDGRLLLISNLDLTALPPLRRMLLNLSLPLGLEARLWSLLPQNAMHRRRMVYTTGSKITEDHAGMTAGSYSLFGLEFFRLFPKARAFRLATAVRMNATFPFVSPAVSLPTSPPRHVVDAGYYDNYGIHVSTAWIHMNREWLIRNTSGVLLVQVRDGLSVLDRWDVDDHEPDYRDSIAQGFQFLLSPLQGAARARASTGMFRNDREIQHLSDWFTGVTGCRAFFTTIVLENPAGVSVLTPQRNPETLPGQELLDVVNEARRRQGTMTGKRDERRELTAYVQEKLGPQCRQDISMNWYLTEFEKEAMAQSFPDPEKHRGAGEGEDDARLRLDQQRQLEDLVAILEDAPRDLAVRELVKIRNYSRIINLKRKWWDLDHSRCNAATH